MSYLHKTNILFLANITKEKTAGDKIPAVNII